MAKSGKERKLRQKQKKRDARQAELADFDTAEAKSPSSDRETSHAFVSADFSAQDLRYVWEYERTANWELKPDHLKTLPETLSALAHGNMIEDGKVVPDPEATPQSMAAASRILVSMQGQVLAQKKQSNAVQFSLHRHYLSRHPEAETPEPDPAYGENPIAFLENTSIEEQADVLEELESLGHLPLFLGIGVNDPKEEPSEKRKAIYEALYGDDSADGR